jgi:hypothetical protein
MTIEEIKEILDRRKEAPNLDYKEDLMWVKENREKNLAIIKDILALANLKDGGSIFIGVRDGDFEFIGMNEDSWDSLDITKITQLLSNYADPIFTPSLSKNIIDGKRIAIIEVPEFAEVPIICSQSAYDKENKEILRKGAIYIRSAKCASEEVSTAEEIRAILGRGLVKKSDELVSSIQKIIMGKPIVPTKSSDNQYKEELESAKEFISKNFKNDFGSWELTSYPSIYNKKRFQSQKEIADVILRNKIMLRGWDFPHLGNDSSNFNLGKQSLTSWENHVESWRFYMSGLFVWKEEFWEDIRGIKDEEGRPVLAYENSMYNITEYFLFLKRIYGEETKDIDTIHVKLKLTKCFDRALDSTHPGVIIHNYLSKEDDIEMIEDIKIAELNASFEAIARKFILNLFLLFNCEWIGEEVIASWQKKLIERKI